MIVHVVSLFHQGRTETCSRTYVRTLNFENPKNKKVLKHKKNEIKIKPYLG